MKRTPIIALLAALALVAAACGGGSTSPEPSNAPPATEAPATEAPATEAPADFDIEAGATAYAASCSACHGADAMGVEGLGKQLAGSDFVADTSQADLVVLIETGRASDDPANTTGVAMPPKGGNPALSDADIINIVAYIKSLG